MNEFIKDIHLNFYSFNKEDQYYGIKYKKKFEISYKKNSSKKFEWSDIKLFYKYKNFIINNLYSLEYIMTKQLIDFQKKKESKSFIIGYKLIPYIYIFSEITSDIINLKKNNIWDIISFNILCKKNFYNKCKIKILKQFNHSFDKFLDTFKMLSIYIKLRFSIYKLILYSTYILHINTHHTILFYLKLYNYLVGIMINNLKLDKNFYIYIYIYINLGKYTTIFIGWDNFIINFHTPLKNITDLTVQEFN